MENKESFEKYWDDNYCYSQDGVYSSAEDAWNYQQAKIEKLESDLKNFKKCLELRTKEFLTLHRGISGVLKILDRGESIYPDSSVHKRIRAFKHFARSLKDNVEIEGYRKTTTHD